MLAYKFMHACTHIDRQTDIDRQTERQADMHRQIYTQADRHTHIHRHSHGFCKRYLSIIKT